MSKGMTKMIYLRMVLLLLIFPSSSVSIFAQQPVEPMPAILSVSSVSTSATTAPAPTRKQILRHSREHLTISQLRF